MKSLSYRHFLVAGSFAAVSVACGGGAATSRPAVSGKPPSAATGTKLNAAAETKFNSAVASFNAHDKAADWNDAVCADVAKQFQAAAAEQAGGNLPEAHFDAGLAYQRCNNDKAARASFETALKGDPKFHHASAQIALYDYKASGNADRAIASLQQAVLDARFQNVSALVGLALVQMERDSAQGQQDCKDDFDCAKRNLQRALAIDDGYMPAFNQLALYYFQSAKKRASTSGGKTASRRGRQIATNSALAKRADVQQLELAALVCSQAVRKNAKYAPIHNTAGLIQNELGLFNGAVAEFKSATALDPRLFEAQMNYGAVNLSFRGFEAAEGAYRRALSMHPNDYDAHLGLALALRGQINDSNYDKQVGAVQAELDAAKKLDGNRPDAFYNEGILTQEFKAKSGGSSANQIKVLTDAKGILQNFQSKASGKSEYDGAAKRAKERIEDIDGTIAFLQAAPPPDATPAPATPGAAPAVPAAGKQQAQLDELLPAGAGDLRQAASDAMPLLLVQAAE